MLSQRYHQWLASVLFDLFISTQGTPSLTFDTRYRNSHSTLHFSQVHAKFDKIVEANAAFVSNSIVEY